MKKFDIRNTPLGKMVSHPEKYDSSLLFRIPRDENRTHYGIDSSNLPFTGFDVWNCYELSFLTYSGLPFSRVLKIIYSSDSPYIVESKSLKLYLNSFNMDHFGKTVTEAEEIVFEKILKDLNLLLETKVTISLFDINTEKKQAFSFFSDKNIISLIPDEVLSTLNFTHFTETPELLRSKQTDIENEYWFYSDLLRSNCRVTNQPDWGDVFVHITTKHQIELSSIIEYLVSFRKENHFHEEVVEMIYKRFYDIFEPSKLMIAAMYTRRGGIDINPVRASHTELIDETLISTKYRLEKRLRQ